MTLHDHITCHLSVIHITQLFNTFFCLDFLVYTLTDTYEQTHTHTDLLHWLHELHLAGIYICIHTDICPEGLINKCTISTAKL